MVRAEWRRGELAVHALRFSQCRRVTPHSAPVPKERWIGRARGHALGIAARKPSFQYGPRFGRFGSGIIVESDVVQFVKLVVHFPYCEADWRGRAILHAE